MHPIKRINTFLRIVQVILAIVLALMMLKGVKIFFMLMKVGGG
jgi:hypothetical protein